MRTLQPLNRILPPPAPRRLPPSGLPPRRPLQFSSRRPSSTKTKPPTNPNHVSTPSSSSKTTTKQAKANRILSRLPRPLHRYASRLRGAPVTHVVAFLVLHEITAVVPLLGLFGLFHYTEYVPVVWMLGHYGGYVREGVGRFERWFRKKGWFGFGEESDLEEEAGQGQGGREGEVDDALRRWEREPKYRAVVEVALAYALTKALLPVRIVGSLWATPWFAGVLGRVGKLVRRGG
ncbi:hypothetical protein N658DRAFT_493484 [Parathielavia hyrcaniae]|uniref:Uncharacterized protein n=1 Tax=Parathielavia hyrcaniae TaxID=113614 RepID=A0AAN6Q945_9PEZI|nr:hypothetical protein N658DRAFT_493484 [Parathielavia hyrcaniae]